MSSPAALARTLSLQRANARAKSCRNESFSEKKINQLSRSIDSLYILSSFRDNSTLASSKQVDGSIIKRSLSGEISYKACLSSISERMDKGIDLWDREFSSMSSYASDQDAIRLCGLQRRISGSLSAKPKDDDLFGKSSVSEDSLEHATLMEAGSNRLDYCPGSDRKNELQSDKCETNHSLQDADTIDSRFKAKAHIEDSSKATINAVYDEEISTNYTAYLPPNSIAVEKVSLNPYEDFRESMYQMIMEKDMEESVDMEELLDSYINLNSLELHDVIREVFSDVWTDIIMRIR